MDNITVNLSQIGYSNEYTICTDGTVKNCLTGQIVQCDKLHRISVKNGIGQKERLNLKELYRCVFNREFCKDDIACLDGEVWGEIPNTNGKYFASSEGRVKSYCGYTAKLLIQYKQKSGYLEVKINGKNQKVHRLVALSFLQYCEEDVSSVVHQKDRNRANNKLSNLELLTVQQHIQKHKEEKKKCIT